MRELTEDRFYREYAVYQDCVLDYCIIDGEGPYLGKDSHQAAVLFAMDQWFRRQCLMDDETEDDEPPPCPTVPMSAEPVDAKEFLAVPGRPWRKRSRILNTDVQFFDNEVIDKNNPPYWFLFLEPPHGTGVKKYPDGREVKGAYTLEDFTALNKILFPDGAEALEVYSWNTDWSEYFDDGHEWWGARCWSIFDKVRRRFVVIGASATD